MVERRKTAASMRPYRRGKYDSMPRQRSKWCVMVRSTTKEYDSGSSSRDSQRPRPALATPNPHLQGSNDEHAGDATASFCHGGHDTTEARTEDVQPCLRPGRVHSTC